MGSERLPVAVIGVGGVGALTLDGLLKSELVEVVGLSDRDAGAAGRAAGAAGVEPFTDNRLMLAQSRPRAVFLAVPPAEAPALVTLCAKQGILVWKELPLARSLAEGVGMVQSMERAGLKLAVGTQRRFAGGYRRAVALRQRLGELFLARAHYLFNWGPDLAWRGDRASAGGGALLELGYHCVDLLTWLLGLPDEVYGAIAIAEQGDRRPPAGQKLQPIHDTDDTAAAILRYGSGVMSTVVTTRCSGPVSEELSIHGRGGWLTASGESCLFRGPDGEVIDSHADTAAPADVFRLQAEAFAKAVMSETPFCECSGRENLLNMAVIEAVYLSDRTSQPEHPLRLLQTHGLDENDCLAQRPPEPHSAMES